MLDFVKNEIIGQPVWIGDFFFQHFIALLRHVGLLSYLVFALFVMDEIHW